MVSNFFIVVSISTILVVIFTIQVVVSVISDDAEDTPKYTRTELVAMFIPLFCYLVFVMSWYWLDATLYDVRFGDYNLFDWWLLRTVAGSMAAMIFSAMSLSRVINKRRIDGGYYGTRKTH